MMKNITVLLVLLVNVLTWTDVYSNTCDEEKVSIFFGNGMFNDRRVAKRSLTKLQIRLLPVLSPDYVVSYDLSYNDNEGAFTQFLEVAVQQQIDNWSSFWNYLSGVEVAPDWFKDATENITITLDEFSYVNDGDLQNHVQKYRNEILDGKKVLVISHSQGNFYANRAYGNVNSDSYGIVAVATPANFVAGGGSYTTLTNDIVINAVRFIDSLTLPANVSNSGAGSDWKGHDFVNSYLNGDLSGPRIVDHILASLENLPAPAQPAETVISCSSPPCDEIASNSSKQYSLDGAQGNLTWSATGTGASIDQTGLLTTDASTCGVLTVTAMDEYCGEFKQDIRVVNAGYWHDLGHVDGPCGDSWYTGFAGNGTDTYDEDYASTYYSYPSSTVRHYNTIVRSSSDFIYGATCAEECRWVQSLSVNPATGEPWTYYPFCYEEERSSTKEIYYYFRAHRIAWYSAQEWRCVP